MPVPHPSVLMLATAFWVALVAQPEWANAQAAKPMASSETTGAALGKTAWVKRNSIDKTVSLELPPNWFYTAQGGQIVATAPQSRAGVFFKVFAVSARSDGVDPQPNVINSAFRPPPAFIHDALAQYHFRAVRIVGWRSDEASGKRCAQLIKRDCEAADVIVRFASVEGAQCVGAFKVVNAVPTAAGQWFSVVAGVWGSSTELALDTPALERATNSLVTADNIARIYMEDPMVQIRLLSNNKLFNSRIPEDDDQEAKKK